MTAEEAVLWMKGAVAGIAASLHVGKVDFRKADHPAFTPGASFEIVVNGRPAGVMGAVSRKLRHPYRVNTQLVLAELAVEPLLKRVDALPKVSAVPQFPMVRRDVAFVAGPEVTHEAVVKCVKKAAPKELTGVELFDIFTSKTLGAGKRSAAYSLAFRSPDRTLKDEEVNGWFARIVEALKRDLGVEVREV